MNKIFSLIIIILCFENSVYALDVKTHEILNQYIAEQNFQNIDFDLNTYLKRDIGFENGVNTLIKFKYIFKWLGEGGIKEDLPGRLTIPYARSLNHFHDPLTDQGFSGLPGMEQLGIESSVIWSQLPVGGQYFGDYSWHDVRSYFYFALTHPENKFREEYFAHMFRGLGQLMHLVEDASVPAHTRNDTHVLSAPYEDWAKTNIQLNPSTGEITVAGEPLEIKDSRANFFAYSDLLQTAGGFQGAEVPVANLMDTNRYRMGQNPDTEPDPGVTMERIDGFSAIGLAEYTNANFLSADTMFDDYPYPKAEHCEIRLENPPDDGIPDLDRQYLSSSIGHPGERLEHLAVVSYLDHFRKLYFPQVSSEMIGVGLDAACHKEYAQKLIPRAVGYSAGLLKYFFRGDINLIPDEENSDLGFVVENNSDEEISGNFRLYYDAADGYRKLIWSRNFSLDSKDSVTGGNRSDNISFGVEFDAAEPGKFILAFKGTSGLETKSVETDSTPHIGAVAGKVISGPALEINASDEGVYAFTDMDRDLEDPMSRGFDRIALQVKNISGQDMDMTGGTIRLGIKYKIGQGDQFRNDPPEPSGDFYYIHHSLAGTYEIPRDQPLKLTFDLSDTPVPLYATDVYLYVVYEGPIGSQTGTCIGFKDISEPTPVHIKNYMDKVCLYGDLYDAGSQEALAQVDSGTVDVYAHDLENIYIKFWPMNGEMPILSAVTPSVTNNHVVSYLGAGEHKVIYFLGDSLFRFSVTEGQTIKIDDRDGFSHMDTNEYLGVVTFNSIINQHEAIEPEDPSYIPGGENIVREFPQEYFQAVDIENYYLKDNHLIRYPIDMQCILE
ncbi:MAG: hypothetical protein C4522_12900 [Desulfobacteraceae bacterium]|nr:MAG: hypothetical protein C4522_12900 [Desulfobacteraceae bacterium]